MYKNNYEQSSLHRLVLLFGIPSILSLMMELMTGIVDTAFAGNLPTGGSDALSAMALISPVLGIFTALQTLFAMSTGILISRYQNDPRRRNDCYLAGVVMTVAVSLTASLICGWQLPNLLTALGATGSIFTSAKQYLQIQLLSNICSSIGYTLTCCIRAFGFPKSEVRIVACSVVTNILFNYIFAFVCDGGISGLAWGTFVSEAVCMGLSAGFLIRKKYRFSTSSLTARTFFRDTRQLLKIGAAQTIIQLLGGFTAFLVNARLLTVGTVTYVAAWSVVQRIYSLVLVPIVGLTQGVQNVISYLNGTHATEKIKTVSALTMRYCSGYGVLALILVTLFGSNLLPIFGQNAEILALARGALLPVFLGFPFIGILYTDMTLLQVTGHEVASVLLILSRQVFFLIPLIAVIPLLFSGSPWGISPAMALFGCMPLADGLASVFAAAVKRKVLRNPSAL